MASCNCTSACNCSSDEVNSSCSPCPTISPIRAPCSTAPIEEVCPKVQIKNYQAAFEISEPFNVPACGVTTIIIVNNPPTLHLNGYIWNATYGFFEITSFTENSITILNRCVAGSAPSGTQVPAGSLFILSDDPLYFARAVESFLAVDFTIPPVGSCSPARFTSTASLPVGAQIIIGNSTFWYTNDLGGNLVQLCNTGQAEAPGTVYKAVNVSGQYLYPISVSSNSVIMESEVEEAQSFLVDAAQAVISTSLLFSNPYTNKPLPIFYSFRAGFAGVIDNAVPHVHKGEFSIVQLTTVVGAVSTAKTEKTSMRVKVSPPTLPKSFQISKSGVDIVAPSSSKLVTVSFFLEWEGSPTPGQTTAIGSSFIRGAGVGIFPG